MAGFLASSSLNLLNPAKPFGYISTIVLIRSIGLTKVFAKSTKPTNSPVVSSPLIVK